ncbi:MAG: sulfatase [Candidatus Sumerlaeia bacterium]
MRVIMMMFDSLNRRFLEPYGCDWVKTPNFRRLAERTVTFENAYVGSMPCMPARREIHTGRYNFLHRSWSPLEPFDDSMPTILRDNGVYSHLVSDHYHYWEDGGCTYHHRYNTWENIRGQEGDRWKAEVKEPPRPKNAIGNVDRYDQVNRKYMQKIEDQPQPRTFAGAFEFLRNNMDQDKWFLHIETFDPHEPYFSDKKYKELYAYDHQSRFFDRPLYQGVQEEGDDIQHIRYESAALHSMCDEYLGRLLDFMDEHDMWKDTMLIVNTDHGFLLAEHDFWGKCHCPFYNEVAHMPLFIWDPRSQKQNERRKSLVQTIDLAPTILEFFGLDLTPDMQGVPLRETVEKDTPVREAGLFGMHGAHVNVTDGRYVYMRAPVSSDNTPLYNYTLMPTHMNRMFGVNELQEIEMAPPFSFTKGCPLMKIPSGAWKDYHAYGTMLFDLEKDPEQNHPIDDPEVEERMIRLMVDLMQANDCPKEQFERLGLTEYV